MKAELVTILGEAGRPGIFLSVKIREDAAGPVLLLLEWEEDATYRDFASNHSLLVDKRFWILFMWAEAHGSFCLRWAQAFLLPFLPFLYLSTFFCELFSSQFLLSNCFPPTFLLIHLVIGEYLSPHPELLYNWPTPKNVLTLFRFFSPQRQGGLKLGSNILTEPCTFSHDL